MKVLVDAQGFVTNFAYEGNLVDSIEVSAPGDLDHFGQHFAAYRMKDGALAFDEGQQKTLDAQAQAEEYRVRREKECFSVINRGYLWYETLDKKQHEELRKWYRSWLDGTETLTVPEKPTWLE